MNNLHICKDTPFGLVCTFWDIGCKECRELNEINIFNEWRKSKIRHYNSLDCNKWFRLNALNIKVIVPTILAFFKELLLSC